MILKHMTIKIYLPQGAGPICVECLMLTWKPPILFVFHYVKNRLAFCKDRHTNGFKQICLFAYRNSLWSYLYMCVCARLHVQFIVPA